MIGNRDYIVRDTSISKYNEGSWGALSFKNMAIRIGIVQAIVPNRDGTEHRYLVEVEDTGTKRPVLCVRGFSKFGGRFNYEEYLTQVYKRTKNSSPSIDVQQDVIPGDMAVVAYVNGEAREGIIIGFLGHPGRKERILQTGLKSKVDGTVDVNVTGGNSEETPTYISEFNGVETIINRLGEYKVTFKGQPTNLKKLDDPVTGAPIPDPVYDTVKGSSFFQFEEDGSYTLSDNSANEQKLKIDKTNKKITITGGKTSLEIDTASDKFDVNVGGKMKIKMTSSTVGIGTSAVELLAQVSDHLQELIDAMKALQQETHIGNLGYPTGVPDNAAAFAEVEAAASATKSKVDSIKGSV